MMAFSIQELIAHSGAMCLLDSIIRYDEKSMLAEVRVHNDGLFGDSKRVPALLGIEYMAQTISAHGGLMDKLANRPSYIGLLLGTRAYSSNISHFLAGTLLRVSVEKIMQDQGLGVYDCKISGPDIIVTANLNVYQPTKPINFALNSQQPLDAAPHD